MKWRKLLQITCCTHDGSLAKQQHINHLFANRNSLILEKQGIHFLERSSTDPLFLSFLRPHPPIAFGPFSNSLRWILLLVISTKLRQNSVSMDNSLFFCLCLTRLVRSWIIGALTQDQWHGDLLRQKSDKYCHWGIYHGGLRGGLFDFWGGGCGISQARFFSDP